MPNRTTKSRPKKVSSNSSGIPKGGAKSDFWKKERERVLVELFQRTAKKIPAYGKFLKKHNIQPASSRTYQDFLHVPSVSKDNYLRAYPWQEFCTPQAFARDPLVLTATSGSTGNPFYFPRDPSIDVHSSIYHELFLKNSAPSVKGNGSTLVIICFGMGVWVGGIITYQAFHLLTEQGHPLTILTPGINKKEIYSAMRNVAPAYDNVILCGYPPFMKDVVDEAKEHGVNWKKHNIRVVFAAEAFSEKFRDYVMKKMGITDVYRDTTNIYGSADLGTMAMETPLCILIRRLSLKLKRNNSQLYHKLFGTANRLPTLVQYIPHFVSFESHERSIYCSGDNALPLVRYEIGDNGGTHDYADIERIFKEEGLDLRALAKEAGIADTLQELPFVYVYERTDLSTKLYGAIIYPEYIKAGLFHNHLVKHVTGKFTLFTRHDELQNEYLEVNVELKKGITATPKLKKTVIKHVTDALLKLSEEYRNNASMMPEKVVPKVVFWPHEHPTHFQVGTKQKWVKKLVA